PKIRKRQHWGDECDAGPWKILWLSCLRYRFSERVSSSARVDLDRHACAVPKNVDGTNRNHSGRVLRDRPCFPYLVAIHRRQRSCHFGRITFWTDANRGLNWRGDLDYHLPSNPLRLGRVDHGGGCAADHHFHHDFSESGACDSTSLFLNLPCRGRDSATSLKSFPSGAWHRATVQTKVNIDKISIIGAGSWGTALAWLWGKGGRQILLWGNNPGRAARIQKTRENADYLPGLKLPDSVNVTHELRDCANADLVAFVTPSTVLRAIAMRLQGLLVKDEVVLLSCTKGIEHGTGMRMSEILGEMFPKRQVAVVSGPNLAVEIVRSVPTATVIGCRDPECAAQLQDFLGSSRFRIYTNN